MDKKEDILQKEFNANPNNMPFDDMYFGELEAIKKAMHIYAEECCKATLEKASEEAEYGYTRERGQKLKLENIFVDKDSVKSNRNIVLL